jgi:hypothetical protein
MNFVTVFKQGQKGRNKGLATGLQSLDGAVDSIQRGTLITVASAPKTGKSTFVNFCYVIYPYLESLKDTSIDIEWIYYSLEMDRVKLEFRFAAFFLFYDYNIKTFSHKGEIHPLSPRYLLGRLKDDDDEVILVSKEHKEALGKVYRERIIPLFGEYDIHGKKLKNGKITIITESTNPTGIFHELLHIASKNGTFIEEEYLKTETIADSTKSVSKKFKRIMGYTPNNPEKYTIIILDHIRKVRSERGYTKKQIIDKTLEYFVVLRNWCNFTFVNISHINRNLDNLERMKWNKERLYPTSGDIKDSSNGAEDSDIVITLFNPHDDKYQLETHFEVELKLHPNYRSIHIVESRDTDAPQHLKVEFFPNLQYLRELKLKS